MWKALRFEASAGSSLLFQAWNWNPTVTRQPNTPWTVYLCFQHRNVIEDFSRRSFSLFRSLFSFWRCEITLWVIRRDYIMQKICFTSKPHLPSLSLLTNLIIVRLDNSVRRKALIVLSCWRDCWQFSGLHSVIIDFPFCCSNNTEMKAGSEWKRRGSKENEFKFQSFTFFFVFPSYFCVSNSIYRASEWHEKGSNGIENYSRFDVLKFLNICSETSTPKAAGCFSSEAAVTFRSEIFTQ